MPHSTSATDLGQGVAVGLRGGRAGAAACSRAVLHREGAGDAEGVEAVQVAAGRQDRRRAQQVAAGAGPDEAAVERAAAAGDLVVLAPAGRSVSASSRSIASVGSPAIGPATMSAIRRLPVDQRLDPGVLGPGAVRRLGHRHSMSTRSSATGGSPTTCRPCGISVYSSSSTASASRSTAGLRRRPPDRLRRREVERGGLRLDQRRRAAARSATSASGVRPRQRSIEALRSSRPR